jgi:hypothetical protein
LAGTRDIAITVLPLSDRAKTSGKQETKEPRDGIEKTVRAAAEDTALAQSGDDEPAPLDVTIREHHAPSGEAVAKEAEKGYDLLVVGVENMRVKNGGFHQDVSRIASAFEGPLAIVAGSGDQLRHPQQSPLHILVPVTGNEVSRRAAASQSPSRAPASARSRRSTSPPAAQATDASVLAFAPAGRNRQSCEMSSKWPTATTWWHEPPCTPT